MAVFSSFAYTTESRSLGGATVWHISVAGLNWHMTAEPLLHIVTILLALLLIRTAIFALICYIADTALKSIPRQYRRQKPGLIWLLLIPLFPFVWNYFVFPPIAKSFRDYFDAAGEKDRSDCGWAMGIAMCICCDATLFRPVALVALLCYVVLLIVILVNLWQSRRKALNLGAMSLAADAEPTAPPSTASPAAPDRPYSPAGDMAQGPRQPAWVVPALIFLTAGFLLEGLPFIFVLVHTRWISGYRERNTLYERAVILNLLGGVALFIGAMLIRRAALAANSGRRLRGNLAVLSALFILCWNLIVMAAWANAPTRGHPGDHGLQLFAYLAPMIGYAELLSRIAVIVFFYTLASIICEPQLHRTHYAQSLFRLLAVAVALVSTLQFALVTRHWLRIFHAHGISFFAIVYGSYAAQQTLREIMMFLFFLSALAALLALPARAD